MKLPTAAALQAVAAAVSCQLLLLLLAPNCDGF
jgi:hypothetical protein